MNKQARELIEKAKLLGFEHDGWSGSGHLVLTHRNGTTYTIAATPSEFRGLRNAIAAMERISGQKLPRPNSRKKKPPKPAADDELAAARRRHAENYEAKCAEIEAAKQAELRRLEAAQRAAADDRRRREIEALMRRGNG